MTVISSFRGEYSFLSNFYQHHMMVGGISYPSMEHYFQAHKSKVKAERLKIAAAPTSKRAKDLGNQVRLRSDWEAVKIQVMMHGLRIKFKSNSQPLSRLLIKTGDSMLIENNHWNDKFWGAVYNLETDKFEGQNWLGSLLMVRRAELRSRL